MKVIDATNRILGRLASEVAKLAISGEEIKVVNCENAVVVGKKKEVLNKYKQRSERGTSSGGPFLHRGPDRIVRRCIRGMIPYKTKEGREAFKRVMCYVGNPDDLEVQKISKDISDTNNLNYVKIADISRHLGAKI
ncbi:MAG: 50S ribosomal protein L13 [Nanobdellota archaeon]